MFKTLLTLLENPQHTLDSEGHLLTVTPRFLRDIILPHGIWSAGRRAIILRNLSARCLRMLMLPPHSPVNETGNGNGHGNGGDRIGYVPIAALKGGEGGAVVAVDAE
ncbi:hypothetical protein HK102_012037, partial [Quaeritorhiza haematococci]